MAIESLVRKKYFLTSEQSECFVSIEGGDLNTLIVINSKFKKWQKNAARNFNSATLFYGHGKNQIQHVWANLHLIIGKVGPRLRLRRPTSVLVIKCTTLLTCIENSYFYVLNNKRKIRTVVLPKREFFYSKSLTYLPSHDRDDRC
jgi:hemin uptake protein HemP